MQYARYADLLAKHGFRDIGHGMYSTVFAKGDAPRVIKVCRGSVDRWPEYIMWAAENGFLGKEAPMVYSIHKNNAFYAAVVERLQRIDAATTELVDRLQMSRWEKPEGLPEEWVPFLMKFREKFGRFGNDIGGANWMQRGKQLVLNDPLQGHSTWPLPRKVSPSGKSHESPTLG